MKKKEEKKLSGTNSTMCVSPKTCDLIGRLDWWLPILLCAPCMAGSQSLHTLCWAFIPNKHSLHLNIPYTHKHIHYTHEIQKSDNVRHFKCSAFEYCCLRVLYICVYSMFVFFIFNIFCFAVYWMCLEVSELHGNGVYTTNAIVSIFRIWCISIIKKCYIIVDFNILNATKNMFWS